MDITSTIQALRERCSSLHNRVYGSAQIAQIDLDKQNPTGLPSAYVMCIREVADGPNQSEVGYQQDVEARVAVVLLIENEDERGQLASATAENLKNEVIQAIAGWSPNSDPQSYYIYDTMWVLANNRAILAIQLEFTCTYAIGYADSRIPGQLDEDCGNFDTIVADVDKIEQPANQPDGQIDAHFEVNNLYGDSDSSVS